MGAGDFINPMLFLSLPISIVLHQATRFFIQVAEERQYVSKAVQNDSVCRR